MDNVFGDEGDHVIEADWSLEWAGWRELVAEILQLHEQGVEESDIPILDAIITVVRRFIRLSVEHDKACVVATDDATQLQRLRVEEELLRGRCETYYSNECCADSMLQLLSVCG